MDPLFTAVITATLARDAQGAALDPSREAAPERRGMGWLARWRLGPRAEAPCVERRALARAR